MERGFHSSTMEEVEISEMERGYLRRQHIDRDTARARHVQGFTRDGTRRKSKKLREAPEGIEEVERGSPTRKLKEPEDLATRLTQHLKLKEGEEGVEPWEKHSIYKVHATMAAVNPEAFTPKMVSMGPYHHGKEHLMPMEVHKQRAARRFIKDSRKSIKDFIDGLWEVLPELMDSYSQLDRIWREDKNKERFLELMLIDGCFLLEILRSSAEVGLSNDKHDPVFSIKGIISHAVGLRADMMMLENQVPFTALEMLLTIKNGNTRAENSKWIKDLMLLYLYARRHSGHMCEGKHMLDVAGHCLFKLEPVDRTEGEVSFFHAIQQRGLVGLNEEKLKYIRDNTAPKKSRSVMELCRAGVKFRKAEEETIPLSSIRFENNGVITIPVIPLHLFAEVHGCNMVAFELSYPGSLLPTLSYFTFMQGLLTSAADVRHLRALKIIESNESSDDAIVESFKRFAKHTRAVTQGTNLSRVQDQLDEFYHKRMTGYRGRIWKWITSLKENYFQNPWTFIAVVSATLLLALTMAQTYYAARPYWDSNIRITHLNLSFTLFGNTMQ